VQNSGSQKWLASSATFRGMISTIVLPSKPNAWQPLFQWLPLTTWGYPLNQTAP
jgi:hypothetical protein